MKKENGLGAAGHGDGEDSEVEGGEEGKGEGEGEEYWTASKWFEDVLVGEGGEWCWEAWEGICGMGE